MYTLTAVDYVIIVTMLLVSVMIGAYFAFRSGQRPSSSSDYFLGDRRLSAAPVAISVAATYVSAITYLGTPAEVYIHGPKYGLLSTVRLFVPLLVAYWAIPVYYRLEITTIFEYLEMRFNNTVRFLVIVFEFGGGFVYMGIVLYAPSLALSTVTGLNLTLSIVAIGTICTFYTTIGGIKAVIWTDVFQAAVMVISTAIMTAVGTIRIGGAAEGWRRAVEGRRTELVDFSIDPTVRLTFWTIYIGGGTFLVMIGGSKQMFVQRFLACKSVSHAQAASYFGLVLVSVMELLAVASGMTMYAYYYVCDPLKSGEIARADQLLPYFVMDLFRTTPGLPGFLMAGVFCACLSSLSSGLNARASVAGQDIVKTIWPNISERRFSVVIRVISVVFGAIVVSLAFLASFLGDVLQSTLSITSLAGGPILGVFILGLCFPRSNSAGATVALVGGTLVGLFFYVGSQIYPPVVDRPPLSTEGCEANLANGTTTVTSPANDLLTEMFTGGPAGSTAPVDGEQPPGGTAIFGLSYMYLSTVTMLSSVLLGLVVSYVTSRNHPKLAKPELLAPFIARRMKTEEGEDKMSGKCPPNAKGVIPMQKI